MTKRRDIVVATPGRLRDVLTEDAVKNAFKKTSLVRDPSRIPNCRRLTTSSFVGCA
jgi:hypothetical protein